MQKADNEVILCYALYEHRSQKLRNKYGFENVWFSFKYVDATIILN